MNVCSTLFYGTTSDSGVCVDGVRAALQMTPYSNSENGLIQGIGHLLYSDQ